MRRTPTIVPVLLLAMNPALYAEDGQPAFLNLEFNPQTLYSIDDSNSTQDNEKIFHHNQRYLRAALKSYSRQALDSIGLSAQTADLVGATLGLAIKGAKLDLNDSKTFAIELKDVVTHDPALYFGYNLDW